MGGVEQTRTSAVGTATGHCSPCLWPGGEAGDFVGTIERTSEREKVQTTRRRRMVVPSWPRVAENLSTWTFGDAQSKGLAGLCRCCCSGHDDGRPLAGLILRLRPSSPGVHGLWFARLWSRARRFRRLPDRAVGCACVEEGLLARYHHLTAAARRFEGRVMSITGEGCNKADS